MTRLLRLRTLQRALIGVAPAALLIVTALVVRAAPAYAAGAGAAHFSDSEPPEKSAPMSPQYVTPTHWFSVTGGAFVPTASGYSYALSNGCLHQNTFANFQNAEYRVGVYVPDGAVLKTIYFNYNVVTPAIGLISSARLARQSATSLATVDLATADKTTSGIQGFGYKGSPEITATVDNLSYTYYLYWNPNGQFLDLCSMQVGYYLDSVFANGFE